MNTKQHSSFAQFHVSCQTILNTCTIILPCLVQDHEPNFVSVSPMFCPMFWHQTLINACSVWLCQNSLTFIVLTLRAFMKRRAQFSQFLSSSTSLSINRYFRLMALATTELLC